MGGLETPNVPRKSAENLPKTSQVLADSCARLPWLRASNNAAAALTQLRQLEMALEVAKPPGEVHHGKNKGKKVGNPWWIVVNIWL